jgi:hypothetical protein
METPLQVLAGADHIGQIRLLRFGIRRGDTEDHDIHVAQDGRIGSGRESPAIQRLAKDGVVQILDIGGAGHDAGSTLSIQIDAAHRKALARKGDRERQTNVTEADDRHAGLAVVDLLPQGLGSDRSVGQEQAHPHSFLRSGWERRGGKFD